MTVLVASALNKRQFSHFRLYETRDRELGLFGVYCRVAVARLSFSVHRGHRMLVVLNDLIGLEASFAVQPRLFFV